MSSDPVTTFFTAVQSRLVALQASSAPVFARVWIAPEMDITRVLSGPHARFPAAFINDEGSQRRPESRQIEEGEFSVTIAVMLPRDDMGEFAELELFRLCELALEGDSAGRPGIGYDTVNAIVSIGTGRVTSFVTEDGIMVVSKPLDFAYILERATPNATPFEEEEE